MAYSMPSLYNWTRQLAYNVLGIPRPEQQPDCYIVGMPANVMRLVADELPLWDQYRFSQACFAIRSAVGDHFKRSALYSPSIEDRITYLSRRAYDLPDHWVCQRCMDLHRVDPLDCPGWRRGCKVPGASYMPSFYLQGLFKLEHRHVQLALKWSRMEGLGAKYKVHLERLLRWGCFDPRQIRATIPGWIAAPPPGTGYYWQQPKVIHGRFMMTAGQVFYPDKKGELGRDDLSAIELCQHQVWLPVILRKMEHVRSLAPGLVIPGQSSALEGALWMEENDLYKSMTGLFRTRGTEVSVSCPFCPADITVTVCREGRPKMEYTCWHDFRPEGSPLDVCWRVKQFPAGTGVVRGPGTAEFCRTRIIRSI